MLNVPSSYLRVYEPGTVIIQQGEPNDNIIYLLISGALTVSKDEKTVAEIKQPGVFFGELSVLLNTPRSATVIALMESKVMAMPYDYNIFFVKFPGIAQKLMLTLAKRLAGR